jgi:catechol 2,3-dioxygenase-like lactoylglutathione lyase family enzyme
LIKIEDIAHVRLAAPDLALMSRFLTDFGISSHPAPDGKLYGRGAGTSPFIHVTEPGEAAFIGLGFRAQSLADLEQLAKDEGTTVEPLNAPGGGFVVTLTDPDGHRIEVVAGQTPVETSPLPSPALRNTALVHERERTPVRLQAGPAHVLRLGHAVLEVSDFRTSEAWFKSRFGFITSDEIEMAPGMAIGAFMRCDRGDTPTDHHTLFLLQTPRGRGLNHAAFEVAHMDDLMCGHQHLKAGGYAPAWGIGRHILGSQIFDYWKDPFGNEMEHWTDGDVFTVADGSARANFTDLLGVQWGPNHPMMNPA